MKKGQIVTGTVERVLFPNKGIVKVEDEEKQVIVKNAIPGQKVKASINKMRKGKAEGRLLEVLEKAPCELAEPECIHFGECGGCSYQNLGYEEQIALKEEQIKELLEDVVSETCEFEKVFEGIKHSPKQFGYRNKMEYTFGDTYKDGPLALGMHKRGSFYDIALVDSCRIVDEDYNMILKAVLDFFGEREVSFYHRMRHEGYLRHLLVRRGEKTGEIMVDLVTSTQNPWAENVETQGVAEKAANREPRTDSVEKTSGEKILLENAITEVGLLEDFSEKLQALPLKGKLVGILHTKNDSVADTITNEGTDILYGQDYFYEELLGLKFKISPFSFFQTNSLGAEVLYETAREFIKDAFAEKVPENVSGEAGSNVSVRDGLAELNGKVIYDLYSGTGTIAQMLAPVAGKVIGVEIVEEAVEAAKENAKLNGLHNCEFIAGDVLKVLDSIEQKPDFIVLDPPRDGIHPKALEKIIAYGVDKMVYISCKPTSLARDLEVLQARGYDVKRICCVDMFPGTVHVETVCLLSKVK